MEIFLTVLGWFAGFASAILVNSISEKSRCLRSVKSVISYIEALMLSANTIDNKFHLSSINLLEISFFNAIAFLSTTRQKDAINVWANFRNLDLSKFADDDQVGEILAKAGCFAMTKSQAYTIDLYKIRSLFER